MVQEKKAMKVLVIVSSLSEGGAQRIASNFVSNLPDEWEVDILINDEKDIEYPYRGKIIGLGISTKRNKDDFFYQLKVFCRRLKVLGELKKNKNYMAA